MLKGIELVKELIKRDGKCPACSEPFMQSDCSGCPAASIVCGNSTNPEDCKRRLVACHEWLASHPEASKPVERFEVGKWYKFVPRPVHVSDWKAEWADGMPKMADKISQEGKAVHFVGVRFGGGQAITVSNTDYFEVPAPTEPPGYTAEAPKTTDPSAEKILAEYYGPLHVQVIKYASGDVKVITPRVGKLSRVQERQRAREARLSRI
jgi:hypothetical protein